VGMSRGTVNAKEGRKGERFGGNHKRKDKTTQEIEKHVNPDVFEFVKQEMSSLLRCSSRGLKDFLLENRRVAVHEMRKRT